MEIWLVFILCVLYYEKNVYDYLVVCFLVDYKWELRLSWVILI